MLATLTFRTPLAGTFFRQLVIGGRLVQLVGLDHLAGLVRLRSGRLPHECVPARCEVLQVGAGERLSWRQQGIDLVRVGVAEVPDAAVFGRWLEPSAGIGGGRPTRLLAAGASAFDRIPALAFFYRDYSWVAPLAPSAIHVWEIGGVLARESRAQSVLARLGAEYELSGPDSALLAARTTAHAAGQRLTLIGGEISALLLGFALVAAVGLRRGLAAERRRLVQRGATAWQVVVAVAAEIVATTLAGGVAGVLAGVAAVAILARRTGLAWGAVLRRGPASTSGLALVLLLWVALARLLSLPSAVLRPESSAGRKVTTDPRHVLAVAGRPALPRSASRGAVWTPARSRPEATRRSCCCCRG